MGEDQAQFRGKCDIDIQTRSLNLILNLFTTLYICMYTEPNITQCETHMTPIFDNSFTLKKERKPEPKFRKHFDFIYWSPQGPKYKI